MGRFYKEGDGLSDDAFLALPHLNGIDVVHLARERRARHRVGPERDVNLMFTRHSGTKFGFEGSFGDFLNLRGTRITQRRVDDDLDIFHRPDDVRQGEEGGLPDGGRGESMAGNDDVIRICLEK